MMTFATYFSALLAKCFVKKILLEKRHSDSRQMCYRTNLLHVNGARFCILFHSYF